MTNLNLSPIDLKMRVNEIFVDLFELKSESLLPDKQLFKDMGLDSLDAIDLIIAFQKEFKIKPAAEEFQKIHTLGDVYSLVETYYRKLH